MIRRCLLVLALVCLCFSVLLAKPGTVKTRDGHIYTGEIREKPEAVDVTTNGITVTVGRENVASIDYASGTIEQEYQTRLTALGKNATAKDHLTLARWLMDNGAYVLAREEVDAALKIEPQNADAIALGRTIDAQLRMGSGSSNPGTGGGGDTSKPVATPVTKSLLTPEQINIMRQMELRDSDGQINARFDNNVQQKYLDYSHADPLAFRNASVLRRIGMIQDIKDEQIKAQMLKDVKVLNDPGRLAEFRGTVQRTVLSGCGAANCHGGTSGVDFVLINPADSDAATYTNFYILTHYSRKIGDTTYKMVNRSAPDKSLLLQYGLPLGKGEPGHPQFTQPTAPVFKNPQDPRFTALVKWIDGLGVYEPEYGFQFDMPRGATSKPTSRP